MDQTAMKKPPSKAPRGRDEVRRALVDAAAELFAARGVASVSVRDIAAAAGVNHGLVHRHFGSKEALRAEVMDHLAAAIDADVGELPDDFPFSDLVGLVFLRAASHSAYFKILARAMLDGEDPRLLQSRFPVVRRLVAAARAAEVQSPEHVIAQRLAQGLGWMVFERYIRAATGLDEG